MAHDTSVVISRHRVVHYVAAMALFRAAFGGIANLSTAPAGGHVLF